ncbi:MAG: hypothetical protein CMH52_01060 [Myxococcales bacterium]|nr:hypothetical protein [Myxococcales bacterium]
MKTAHIRRSAFSVLLCALTMLGGCETTAPKKASSTASTGKELKKADLTVPESLLVYAGITAPNDTLKSLSAIANTVQPGMPDATMVAPPLIQNEFRLMSPAGIDLSKSIGFALFERKTYGRDPSATLVGMTSKDQFVQSLPKNNQKQNDAGNAYSYLKWAGAKTPVFVNFIGQHAVLTRHPDLFPTHKAFLSRLAGHRFKKAGSVFVSLDNVYRAEQKEIDNALAQAKAKSETDLANSPAAASVGFFTDVLESIPTLMKQLASAEFILSADPSGLGLNFLFSAKDGTRLGTSWAKLKGAEHTLLKTAPMDTVAFGSVAFAASAEPNKLQETVLNFAMNALKSVAKVDAAIAKEVEESGRAMLKQMTGHFLAIVHPYPGSNGLLPSVITGIKDASVARAAYTKSVKAMAALTANAELGITSNFSEYKIGDAPVTVQKTVQANANPMMAMLSAFNETHTVITKGKSIVAYGAAAKPELERAMNGANEGFTKTVDVKRLTKKGVAKAFMYAFVSPVKLMQRVSLGGMNPFAATLTGLEAQGGLGFVLGAEGNKLNFLIDIPTTLLKDGMAVFTRVKGGL